MLVPIRPWDHPDLVPARAVAVAVLDRDEAELIAATRLEQDTLARVAARIGTSAQRASDWRARAEARLREAIGAGELSFVPLRVRQRPHRGSQASAVGPVLGGPAATQAALGPTHRPSVLVSALARLVVHVTLREDRNWR